MKRILTAVAMAASLLVSGTAHAIDLELRDAVWYNMVLRHPVLCPKPRSPEFQIKRQLYLVEQAKPSDELSELANKGIDRFIAKDVRGATCRWYTDKIENYKSRNADAPLVPKEISDAVSYNAVLRHPELCPKHRSPEFETKRQLILSELAKPSDENSGFANIGIDRLIAEDGRGDFCREYTAKIENYKSRNEE